MRGFVETSFFDPHDQLKSAVSIAETKVPASWIFLGREYRNWWKSTIDNFVLRSKFRVFEAFKRLFQAEGISPSFFIAISVFFH